MWRRRITQHTLATTKQIMTSLHYDKARKSRSNYSTSLKGGTSSRVVLQVKGVLLHLKESSLQVKESGDNAIIIFGVTGLEVFGRSIQYS